MAHTDLSRLNAAELTNPRRLAMLAVHTSPLAQPGVGDAGGMNVYVLQSALHLARRGVEVEIFTRATASTDPPVARVAPGVLVRNVVAGPFEGLDKYDLPTQLCAFAAGVLRAEAAHEPGYYDIVHSHYWLSGQVGWLARDRWSVPLVHTAHTLAKVKNRSIADGDRPEPKARVIGWRRPGPARRPWTRRRGGGGRWRAGDTDDVWLRFQSDRPDRHYPVDRNRQEERHHDGGLRDLGRA